MVAEEFLFTYARGVNIYIRLVIVFYYLSSSRRLHRLSTNLTARAYIRVVLLTVFSYNILYFIMSVCCPFPLVTSQV